MTDLQRALYQFAQENRVYSLLHTERQELREGQKLVQEARAGLRALGWGMRPRVWGKRWRTGCSWVSPSSRRRSSWRDWPSGWSWGGGRF